MSVVVARRDVPAGERISQEDVYVTHMPKGTVDDSAVRDAAEVVGRTAAERLLTHEYIRFERLLPEGMELVEIPISAGSAAPDFVSPGDRVDLLVTGAWDRGAETRTLLQAATVVTIDRGPTPTVTLSVTPDLVGRLVEVVDAGTVTLTLRSTAEVATRLGPPEPGK